MEKGIKNLIIIWVIREKPHPFMWVNLAETNTPKKALNLNYVANGLVSSSLYSPWPDRAKYGGRTRAAV